MPACVGRIDGIERQSPLLVVAVVTVETMLFDEPTYLSARWRASRRIRRGRRLLRADHCSRATGDKQSQDKTTHPHGRDHHRAGARLKFGCIIMHSPTRLILPGRHKRCTLEQKPDALAREA